MFKILTETYNIFIIHFTVNINNYYNVIVAILLISIIDKTNTCKCTIIF